MSFPPSCGKDEKRRRPSPAYAGPGPGSLSAAPVDSLAARLGQIQRHHSLPLTYYTGGSPTFHAQRWGIQRELDSLNEKQKKLLGWLNAWHADPDFRSTPGFKNFPRRLPVLNLACLQRHEARYQELRALNHREYLRILPIQEEAAGFIRATLKLQPVESSEAPVDFWPRPICNSFDMCADYILLSRAGFHRSEFVNESLRCLADDVDGDELFDCAGCSDEIEQSLNRHAGRSLETAMLPGKLAWDQHTVRAGFGSHPLFLSQHTRHKLAEHSQLNRYRAAAREIRLRPFMTWEPRFSMEGLGADWCVPAWPAHMDPFIPADGDPRFSLAQTCLVTLDRNAFRATFDHIAATAATHPDAPYILAESLSAVEWSHDLAKLYHRCFVLDFTPDSPGIYLPGMGFISLWLGGERPIPSMRRPRMLWLFKYLLALHGVRELRLSAVEVLHQSCPVRNPHDPTAPLFAPEQHPLPWRFKGNKRMRDDDDDDPT